jgi:hypothetical protein
LFEGWGERNPVVLGGYVRGLRFTRMRNKANIADLSQPLPVYSGEPDRHADRARVAG